MRSGLCVITAIALTATTGCTLENIPGCDENQHVTATGCAEDTTTKCGSETNNCKQEPGWSKGKCVDAQCMASKCTEGYHLREVKSSGVTKCEADTRKNCGEHGNACDERAICEDGVCVDCPKGYHVDEEKCLKDELDPCKTPEDCESGQICLNGGCVTCGKGEHVESNQCVFDTRAECNSATDCDDDEICFENDCRLCALNQHREGEICVEDEIIECTTAGDCGQNQICTDQHCNTCSLGQHRKGETCVENTYLACGSEDIQCTDTICFVDQCIECPAGQHATNGECIVDKETPCTTYEECGANEICNQDGCEACPAGQHADEGNCVFDDQFNCGIKGRQCSRQICVDGQCIPCSPGQHAGDNVCVDDSLSECGNDLLNCPEQSCGQRNCERCTNGVCDLCPVGQHASSTGCEPDSTTACGVDIVDCTVSDTWTSASCSNGQCIPEQCASGYCLSSNTCIDGNSDTACGSANNCQNCETLGKVCSNGKCIDKKCDKGVCDLGNGVCQNTNEKCGSSCQNCTARYPSWTGGICTADGTCSASGCVNDYHLSKNSQGNNTCTPDSKSACGAKNDVCDNYCFAGGCTSVYLTYFKDIKCGADKYEFKIKLLQPPTVNATVKVSIVDSSGNVLTGKTNGIALSKTTFSFTQSNFNKDQSFFVTPSNINFVPDQNFYTAKIQFEMSASGYKTHTSSLDLNYYAFCNRTFDYTGSYQTISLPKGSYKLTVLGAGGGGSNSSNGGKGGKATGTVKLTSKTTAYVYVGGKGEKAKGGYNGGSPGSEGSGLLGSGYGYGGGGATDIRFSSSAVGYRVIVGGGGGGGFGTDSSNPGGYGGGMYGKKGSSGGSVQAATLPGGPSGCYMGTDKTLCKFGTSSPAPDAGSSRGGGGGGWFGGATGQANKTSGAGGSGYTFTSATTSYKDAGGKFTDTKYALTSPTKVADGGAAANTNGSALIEVVADSSL